MTRLDHLDTERSNPRTARIGAEDSLGIVRLINQEDHLVAAAVEKELPRIAQAVDAICEKLQSGGRLIYCGAGTSGRLGVLDAAECPPTYGVSPELVRGLIAGGPPAFLQAVEGAEDNRAMGRADLERIGFSARDVLVGIAASGRTPYVLGAMDYARAAGATVVGLANCGDSELSRHADICIAPLTGPEAITGSTRMKSGTAQKMVLNMLSTASMVRLGKVYGNLMVDMRSTNEKLTERAVSIVRTATGADIEKARSALAQSGYSCKHAIVMILLGVGIDAAREALERANGHISRAVSAQA